MNQLIATIFSLRGEQLDNIIELALVIGFISIYLIPLAIVIIDLWKRYEDKFFKYILTLLAILTLPAFIIPYILFRKTTTLEEDNSLNTEYEILATANNCVKCTKCYEINHKGFNYCIKCGNILTTVCKNCALNIDLNWNHCAFCGIILKENLPEIIPEIMPEVMPENIPKIIIDQKQQTNIENISTKAEIKLLNTTFLKNKKIIYAIGEKINSLITVQPEVYK